jgi:hypothetical protein
MAQGLGRPADRGEGPSEKAAGSMTAPPGGGGGIRLSRGGLLLAGALVVGAALRLKMLLVGRSLWLDEAMLALNICGRSFAGLWRPLDLDQGAPVGFLMVERLAVLALGPNELALRLVPFLASVVTLFLIARFARVHFGEGADVVAVGMASVMPALVYYGAEGKQYALDVAVGLAILVVAAEAMKYGLTRRRAIGLAAVGAGAVWFSHPSLFVLAGAGTALALREIVHRRVASVLALAPLGACWVASFGVNYALCLRSLQANASLADFWASAFLPFPPLSSGALRQYVVLFLGLFETLFQVQDNALGESLDDRMALVTAAAWGGGVCALAARGRRGGLALLVGPLAFAALASMLHRYPLRGRLVLFTAGPTILVATAGLMGLLRSREKTARAAGAVLLAALLALPAMQAGLFLAGRPGPWGARPVLEQLAREGRPGDVVLVTEVGSAPAFRFYREYGQIAGLERLSPTIVNVELRDPDRLMAELERFRDRPRVWVLFSDHGTDPGGREGRFLRFAMDRFGTRKAEIAAKGYFAWMYDLEAGPSAGDETRLADRH